MIPIKNLFEEEISTYEGILTSPQSSILCGLLDFENFDKKNPPKESLDSITETEDIIAKKKIVFFIGCQDWFFKILYRGITNV